MSCFEGFVDRHMWWSNMEVNMFEGAPGRITKYMYLKTFADILLSLSYTDKNVLTYNDKLFHIRQMEYAWNTNTTIFF